MGFGNALLTSRQGVRAYMQQSRIFVGMVLILIFGEVLGLYGYVSEEGRAVPVRHTDRRQANSGVDIEHKNRLRSVTFAKCCTITGPVETASIYHAQSRCSFVCLSSDCPLNLMT